VPRGRKPKAAPVAATPAPEKKKRGRPKKIVDPPVAVEAPKVEVKAEPIVVKTPKVEPVKPAPPPIDPETQKLIDKSNADFKKKIDAAMKDATPENAISKLFEALGGGSVNW